ncbi:MAG: molybdate ABC transporter substrate-binding protein [Pseudomonadota bacterium]
MTVFAAASLAEAIGALVEAYERETGTRVRVSLAASSTLARQIEAGAPADIYAAAHPVWMDRLERAGLIAAPTRTEALANALVLVGPADHALAAGEGASPAAALAAILAEEGARIAVGDPEHVPVGLYAKAALETLGLWDTVAPRLARTDNARAALALVARGEAYAIVYASDTRLAPLQVLARFPKASHPPIRYPFAVVTGRHESPAVRALFARLTGPEAAAVYARYGFEALP